MKKLWSVAISLAAVMALFGAAPQASHAAVFISVGIAPPELPVYEQPLIPGPGYIWTPGYWAWGPEGYYWVPGTWVEPPTYGMLWTPGYWGWGGSAFLWHAGYWGPHVGFYGGINYGFGYGGVGYEGGYWRGHDFFYNRNVNRVDVNIVHNVYEHPVPRGNEAFAHTSFNGGRGGVEARANGSEMAAARERHVGATHLQSSHQMEASHDRAQFASANGGHPPVAAMGRPGDRGHAIAAQGAPAHPNVEAVHPMNARGEANGARNEPNRSEPNRNQPNNNLNHNAAGNNAGRTGNNPAANHVNPAGNARVENNGAMRANENVHNNATAVRENNNARTAVHTPSPQANQHPMSERMPNGERPSPAAPHNAPAPRPMAMTAAPHAAPAAPHMAPAPHAAPAPAPHAAPAPAPHAAPAPAPHPGGGGGGGGEHHR